MSASIIDRIRRFYEASNQGDFDEAMGALEPVGEEIEWVPSPIMVDTQQTYRGRSAMRQRLSELTEHLEQHDNKPVEFIESGERTFVAVHLSAMGRSSGVPFEADLYQVITTSEPGETIVRIEHFFDRAEALRAAGVAE